MKNFLIIIIVSFLLTGCIPFLSFFPNWGWLAVDGTSYITTGKSTKDHALSFAMNQDCAMYRIVKGEKICHVSNNQIGDLMYAMNCKTFTFDEEGFPFCVNEEN